MRASTLVLACAIVSAASVASAQEGSVPKRAIDTNDWFGVAATAPWIGGRVEAPRFRWEHFQLSTAMGHLSTVPGLKDETGVSFGVGVVGLGGKIALDSEGRHELGFLAWPLYVGVTRRTQSTDDALELVLLNPYYAFRFDAVKLEIGVHLPAVWVGETLQGDVSEQGFYRSRSAPTVQLYAGVGF